MWESTAPTIGERPRWLLYIGAGRRVQQAECGV